MQSNTKVILTRRAEWLNRFRMYKVFIDNAEAGGIKNGASEEFLISPGIHTIQCKIAWYSSPVFTVTLEPGQIEYLMVKSGIKYYWQMIFLLFIGMIINLNYLKNLAERPLWVFILKMVLILPSLLYMLYYLTLGRKQYLSIEEDRDNIFAS